MLYAYTILFMYACAFLHHHALILLSVQSLPQQKVHPKVPCKLNRRKQVPQEPTMIFLQISITWGIIKTSLILNDDGFFMTSTLAQKWDLGTKKAETWGTDWAGEQGVGVRAGFRRSEAGTDEERLTWAELQTVCRKKRCRMWRTQWISVKIKTSGTCSAVLQVFSLWLWKWEVVGEDGAYDWTKQHYLTV